jgi:hypothetical protein
MTKRRPRSGDQGFEAPAPKPYDFVPFAPRLDRARPPGHEGFHLDGHLSGRLEYELVAHSHVHVSSGNYALSEDLGFEPGEVIRSCYRVTVNGRPTPAVPGSSLKGAIRAIAEAVSPSCISVTRVNWRQLPQALSRSCPDRRRPDEYCPACAIFGAMGRLGRISMGDALLVQGETALYRLPALYRPRERQARQAYLDRQGNFKGRKFYFHGRRVDHEGARFEVIDEGSRLVGALDFTGLKPAELGLVLFALGLDGSFQPMLGGGKPVCLGRVEVVPRGLALATEASFIDYDAGDQVLAGAGLDDFVREQIEEATTRGLILSPQRKQLRRILDPDNPRPAPTGMY